MTAKKTVLFLFLLLAVCQYFYAMPLAEQFKQEGYIEICNKKDAPQKFDSLYARFDELIEFLQTHPAVAQKLYIAKERFTRSKEKSHYSTDIVGFYDESERKGRNQISFYYSLHFHMFISAHYPELSSVSQISSFFTLCLEIYQTYKSLFKEVAAGLRVESIFFEEPPILIKLVKYYPSYIPTKPHYDGSAFSLFIDSTDDQVLLLSPYKSIFAVDDFVPVQKKDGSTPNSNSVLLIPGALLTEFSIYPTPHIVASSGKIRYATIAFAMRSGYIQQKIELSSLPSFRY